MDRSQDDQVHAAFLGCYRFYKSKGRAKMRVLIRLHRYLERLPVGWFIVVVTFLTFAATIPALPLAILHVRYIGEMGGPTSARSHTVAGILLLLVFGPLLESLLNQWAVIKLLRRTSYLRDRDIAIALLSAFLFGCMHSYSIIYVVYAFLIGIPLAYAFIVYEYKQKSPFWVVAAIHSLRNLVSSLLFLAIG